MVSHLPSYDAGARVRSWARGRAGPMCDGAGAHAGARGLVRGLVQRQGSRGGGGAGVGRLVGCLARLNQWLAGPGVEPTGPSIALSYIYRVALFIS
jgi:hypothetical protein